MSNFERHPKWKAALDDFLAAGFGYGDTVTHEWLGEALGLRALRDDEMITAREADKRRLTYVQGVEKLKEALQIHHLMMLEPVTGVGYRIVDPGEQTLKAMERCEKEMKRVLRKGVMRVSFIDYDRLSADQRRQNSDARAKLSHIAGFSQKKLKAPF